MKKNAFENPETDINKRPEGVIIERPLEMDETKHVNGNFANLDEDEEEDSEEDLVLGDEELEGGEDEFEVELDDIDPDEDDFDEDDLVIDTDDEDEEDDVL
jgi:hypothetical protein